MNFINNFKEKIQNSKLSFKMSETMSGYHEFEDASGPSGQMPFEFNIDWKTDSLTEWINPKNSNFMVNKVNGTISIGGLANNIPCSGNMEVRYFKDNKIKYDLNFSFKNKKYHFVGEKINIKPWNLPVSHTTCFGVLTEAKSKKLISKSVTFFSIKTLPSFLLSFRVNK